MDGAAPSSWAVLPFVILLLAIAAMPFIARGWWERWYRHCSVGLGLITTLYYVVGLGRMERVLHSIEEYVSFIALIGSLFVIAGGIHITIKGRSTPLRNVLLLAAGAVMANLLGTTGASMLLIRPYIRNNRYRISAFHIVFFIILVSNVGGGLTPIGDPPLFLGYVRGVPFFWITEHALLPWALAMVLLLGIFFAVDMASYRRVKAALRAEVETEHETTSVKGLRNLVPLAVVIGAVFIDHPLFLREAIMLAAAFVSYRSTNAEIRRRNHFTFHPIEEVAWLFLGIFLAMMPALDLLATHSSGLGIDSAGRLYWSTGVLSSLLDNAPTYLSFLAATMGAAGRSIADPAQVREFLAVGGVKVLAVSVAAVFFGAMTYIGNGPNFMVKSIAEHAGIRLPGFFGYIARFSLPVLLPVLIIVWLLLFL